MAKVNCWEYLQCGREPGGVNVGEMGVCPVAEAADMDNTNGGVNAGRFCWAVSGTLCHGRVQGHFAQKLGDCVSCEFYWHVRKQEGRDFVFLDPRAR